MNNNYKLTLIKKSNQTCLQLRYKTQVVRNWYGRFAELIFSNTLNIKQAYTQNQHSLYFTKYQIQSLFTEITCLYQFINYQLKIDKDLVLENFPNKTCHVAEYLLFQIRINPIHMAHDDLLFYFLEEHNHYDISIFDKAINLLVGNNLIQMIITDDGEQFFDKNSKPHDHIYFKEHKTLVDCSSEISNMFSGIKLVNQPIQKLGNVYTINNEIF